VSAANKSNQRPIFAHHGAPRRRRRTADLNNVEIADQVSKFLSDKGLDA
jgi:hypothetical protein